MVNDMIADSITRIRNACMRRLDVATLLYSKIVVHVLDVFLEKGFIESYKVNEEGIKKSISVVLKYDEKGRSAISELKRISSPGRRQYRGYQEMKRFKNGYGTIVVSTSKGVMSNDKAHHEKVGGEVLCSIW